mgnify:CR=1 FL=1
MSGSQNSSPGAASIDGTICPDGFINIMSSDAIRTMSNYLAEDCAAHNRRNDDAHSFDKAMLKPSSI